MSAREKNETVFQYHLGRLQPIKKLGRMLAEKIVMPLGVEYLSQSRPQLVCFTFDYVSLRISLDGVYELEELETLFGWLRRDHPDVLNGVAVDVGANPGNHSLYFSRFFSKVISFEPHPRTFKVLSLNAELVPNVECHNCALSNVNGRAYIHSLPSNMGASFIEDIPGDSSQQVDVRCLDRMLDVFERVSFIKLDVEGTECNVIDGAQEIIERDMPCIVCEQHAFDFVESESNVVRRLKKVGYSRFFTVHKAHLLKGIHPRILRTCLRLLHRMIRGERMSIVCQDHVEPRFYPFIIALP